MSKALVTGGRGLGGGHVILRLVAAGREVRTMLKSGNAQPGAGVWFVTADFDRDAGRLDAVAGCEYVDDRIRLPER